ncbi:hypothetical protein [uncultured Sphingomonas sp.]|uniref:hypothetical protein n=1 Tax=uncultured Sphingomonas sp. TaxID=158754 RepID=UPI0025D0EAEB|nr:hypothetical protein [uncultured Sphingomonas sp.]
MIDSPFTHTSREGFGAAFGLLAHDDPETVARIIAEGIEQSREDAAQFRRWREIAGCFNAIILADTVH